MELVFEVLARIAQKVRDVRDRVSPNDLRRELNRRALESSAEFVEANLLGVPSVLSREAVHDLAWEARQLDGLVMEFGVYRARTLNYLTAKTSQTVYGFDSFEGLPEFWRDGIGKGAFALDGLPKVRPNVVLVKGWFDERLPKFLFELNSSDPLSYLHIDCDLYSSTTTVLRLLAPRILPGTVIVFDEFFNYPGWQQGEFRAFADFCTEHSVSYEVLTYNSRHEQVAVRIVSKA